MKKSLIDQLSQYAAYHRDRRNIATHFIGVPMIVLAVQTLLARPGFELAGIALSLATLATVATAIYYLRLDLRFGLAMGLLLAVSLGFAQVCAAASTPLWLWTGLGLFVVGWAFQFVGHYFEGRKPAFVDDIVGLVVAPLFVLAELAFAIGLRPDVQHAIEARAGAVKTGRAAAASR